MCSNVHQLCQAFPNDTTAQVDVDKRWSAEQLLVHPFLRKAAESRKIIPLIKAAKEQLDK